MFRLKLTLTRNNRRKNKGHKRKNLRALFYNYNMTDAKIGAGQTAKMPYRYDAALNMHVLGPGEPALSEWRQAGLALPDMAAVRHYRLQRVQAELRRRDIAAAVLVDPLNIRYASDSTNMQLWTSHNAARYCFVAADGPLIVFDYHDCEHLSAHNPLINEIRPACSWFYFSSGERLDGNAKTWAAEIADLVQQYGGDNRRLAIDKINPEGAEALTALGIAIENGEALMEHARMVKCEEELKAMRCAIHACDSAIDVMRQHAHPGISENRLWAHLHAENIARGGEWIETRILAAGPRTNPWFQESSSRPIQAGELMAFDTDLIGAYGCCVDISRTWLIGSDHPTAAQQILYDMAIAQVQQNLTLIRPGMTWRELSEKSLTYCPDTYLHYSCLYHGVGLCDEYPSVTFPHLWKSGDDNNRIEAGMMLCVESYVGRRDGGEGMKYEEQVIVRENGAELISHYPIGLTL